MRKTFYTFDNNFRRTNTYLNDDPTYNADFELAVKPIEKEAVFFNNQKISESIHSLKQSYKNKMSNSSTPKKLPAIATNHGKSSLHNSQESISALSPIKNKNRSVDVELISKFSSPLTSKASNGLNNPPGFSPTPSSSKRSTLILPEGRRFNRGQSDITDELKMSSEKRIIATIKLEQDRIKTMSRSLTKRNVSYMNEPLTANLQYQGTDKELSSSRKATMHLESPRTSQVFSAFKSTRADTIKMHPLSTTASAGFFPKETPKMKGDSQVFAFDHRNNSDPHTFGEGLAESHQHFNDYFIPNLSRPVTENMSGLDHSLNNTLKPKKAFEIGTTEGAFIPRVWTAAAGGSIREITSSQGRRNMRDNSLAAEILKEIPHMFTEAPASRQDVKVLANWMEEKVNSINKGPASDSDKYTKCDEVYNLCLNELLRQVSVDCIERGELLYKIWISYYKMFSSFKTSLDTDIEKTKIELNRESQRLYVELEDMTKLKDDELATCKREILKLVSEKEESEKKISRLTDKESGHKQKIEKLVNILNQMKGEMQRLAHDNLSYIKKYEKKQDYGNKFGTKFREPAPAKPNPAKLPLNKIEGSSVEKPAVSVRLETGALNTEGGVESLSQMNQGTQVTEMVQTVDSEESDKSDSNAPSLDFIYEDLTEMEKIARADPKKAALLDDGSVKIDKTTDAETQTHLFLVEAKYDTVLDNQYIIDEIIMEFKLRKEVDGLLDAETMGTEDTATPDTLQEKLFKNFYATRTRIDSIGDLSEELHQGGGSGSGTGRSTGRIANKKSSNGPQGPGVTKVKKGSKRVKAKNQKDPNLKLELRASLDEPNNNNPNNTPQIEGGEQENSPAKTEQGIEGGSTLLHLGLETPTENMLSARSMNENEDLQQEYEEDEEGEDGEEYEEISMQSGDLGMEDLSNYVAGDETNMGIIEEAEDEDYSPRGKASQNQMNPSFGGAESHARMESRMINISPVQHVKSPTGMLMGGDKVRIQQHHQGGDFQPKQDKQVLYDKARLLLMTRLYKVQMEKNKILSANNSELQESFLSEKQNVVRLEDAINELNSQVQGLKASVRPSMCYKCAYCNGEKVENYGASRNDITGETSGLDMDEEDEFDEDDDENEGDKSRKNKLKKKMTMKGPAIALHIPGNKRDKAAKVDNTQAANAIIEKIKSKKMSKFKNFLPMKAVCKQIYNFYLERIKQVKENSAIKEEHFTTFIYTWFATNFGFKKLAEQKFIVFVLSIKKYLHIVRINLFARFMNLLDGASNFTLDEFNKYLEALDFVNTSNLGFPMTNNEADSKQYTPFLRALEYTRMFSENKMPTEEYIDFKKEVENLKENDPKNLNRNGIIDIDRFISKVLGKYRVIMNRTKQFVVNAFKAADLDGNKYCSLKEFSIIYRNIESEKYDFDFVEQLFSEHADVKVEGEINLSFDKFTVVCVEYGLFSDEQQDHFLGISGTSNGLREKLDKLLMEWPLIHAELSTSLETMKKIEEEDKKYWLEIVGILHEKLSDVENLDAGDIKPILIAYEILDKELKILIDSAAEKDAYGVKKLTVGDSMNGLSAGLSNGRKSGAPGGLSARNNETPGTIMGGLTGRSKEDINS